MKKIFSFLFLVFIILGLTGCKSEDELIWEDAAKDEIYDQRITIYDYKGHYDAIEKVFVKDADIEFYKDIEKLNELKSKNKFAKKFLDLLKDTNIQEIIDKGNDLEKYLLLTYLSVETNHSEGIGSSEYWLSDNKYVDYDDELIKVYYCEQCFDNDKHLDYTNHYPNYLFEYSTQPDSNSNLIMFRGYISSNGVSGGYIFKYNDIEKSRDHAYEFGKINWIELDQSIIDKVITNNKEFLNFYIKYKNDVYYKRYDTEHNINSQYHAPSSSSKTEISEPKIGMTASEVRNSTWGSPKKINKDTYAWGTTEQWVYDNGYIYFRNGFVTSISER